MFENQSKNTIGCKPIHSIDENNHKRSQMKIISDLKPKWSSLKITFIL